MELGSTFSIEDEIVSATGVVDGAVVQVDTVFVEEEQPTMGHGDDTVTPVDLIVGVTVADGLVKAAGLLSLSTKGLIGMVPGVADVPALEGSGRGRVREVFTLDASVSAEGGGGVGVVGIAVALDRLGSGVTGFMLGLCTDTGGGKEKGLVAVAAGVTLDRIGDCGSIASTEGRGEKGGGGTLVTAVVLLGMALVGVVITDVLMGIEGMSFGNEEVKFE